MLYSALLPPKTNGKDVKKALAHYMVNYILLLEKGTDGPLRRLLFSVDEKHVNEQFKF